MSQQEPHGYWIACNLDRGETDITWGGGLVPPVEAVIKIEDELLWHYPQGVFARGVAGSKEDRHFDGEDAVIVGFARMEMKDEGLL
jgi:hypothetical protein